MVTEQLTASPFTGEVWEQAVTRFMGSRIGPGNLEGVLGPINIQLRQLGNAGGLQNGVGNEVNRFRSGIIYQNYGMARAAGAALERHGVHYAAALVDALEETEREIMQGIYLGAKIS